MDLFLLKQQLMIKFLWSKLCSTWHIETPQKTFKTLVVVQLVEMKTNNNTVKVSFEDLTTVYALANLNR